ncbi:glycosyltransferase family 4 protein [Heliomarina baculiformis]|uniref:glycosyltransferase family 4 protein n=1 Tax=Heliomarina baculiformis TaxID=2872036 RepID=UPI001EE208CB|nr:glycosyltransferase family 4 protein [Heliomarina baculiformis]
MDGTIQNLAREGRGVLIVARRLDTMQSGSSQYIYGYLKLCRDAGLSTRLVFAPRRSFGNLAWARVHRDFADVVDDIVWPQAARFGDLFVSTSPKVWGRFLRRALFEMRRRLSSDASERVPSLLGKELSEDEAQELMDLLAPLRATIVTAEYSSLGPLLSGAGDAFRVVFLHDLFSLRAESFLSSGGQPDHHVITMEEEVNRCRAADLLIHASCSEYTAMKAVFPQVEHVWMRPTVNVRDFDVSGGGEPHAVFMGSLHQGNIAALDFLRRKVWPLVRAQKPEARMHIVGTVASLVDPEEAEREGLVLVGPVDDLSEIGGENAIGLAPMDLGSGIPIKIVDYLALRMPVVATSGALASFGGALDGLLLEPEDLQGCAAAILELLDDEDLRRRLSQGASAVRARLSNEPLIESLGPALTLVSDR